MLDGGGGEDGDMAKEYEKNDSNKFSMNRC